MSSPAVPGQWGTTDTSRPDSIEWPASWAGAKNLRAQWFKILAESPEQWEASGYSNHAKGEPPDNTYYLWRHDTPLPEGTKILIEGDFPHARMVSFQVCAPWNDKALVSSDGTGLPEVHLLDEDIVPDPGSTNPYLPGANRKAAKRHYHITFELRDGDPVALNGKAAVAPYRASGNLRIGCTGTAEPGKTFGAKKTRGPVVYMRMYLPDHYDPYGGVEPPVIRLQLPGGKPELAPISRSMPVNLRKFVEGYSLEENPAQANGLSLKEEEANRELRAYAIKAVASGGTPGTALPQAHALFDNPDGTLRLFKSFQTPWMVTYLKEYVKDQEACREKLPKRYRYAFGDMGPKAKPPGNDEHVSNHHVFNTYLIGAANLGPNQLLVFRGKAPRTPRTLNGDTTMGDSSQLRYWNLTMQAGNPTRLTPVINITDETVTVDKNGWYTIVIGRAQDRPQNATPENGITWRTWPAGAVLSQNWRIMSTAATPWEHAPQRVTWEEAETCEFGKNPKALRARMGEYFPQGRYVDKAEVTKMIATGAWQKSTSTTAAGTDAAAGSRDMTLQLNGQTRSYRLHLPKQSHTGKLPVIMALHGGQSTGEQMEEMSELSILSDKEGFIAVYPNAIGHYRGKLYWNDGRVKEVDDVGFLAALIDELVNKHAADPKRIYVTGLSNGASMTNRVGIELSTRIAAIAPIAGTIGKRVADDWEPARAVPVMYFHGTEDPLAYYEGGSKGTYRGSALSAPDYMRWWAKHDGCTPDPLPAEPLPNKVNDGTAVQRIRFANCQQNSELIFYRIEGGGHTWPGGKPWAPESIAGKTSRNISASQEMWRFFSRHPLP